MADFALKAVMGISSGVVADAQVSANNTVNEANAYAQNLVRAANNRLKVSRTSLARYTQSVNNQRVLENTGSAAEAAGVNYRRARDSAMADDFESQLAFSEQAGAQAAAGALSGLTGGVADLVAGTTALRKARLQQRASEALKQGDYDAAQRNKQILEAGWDSLDSSEIADDLDFSTDVAVKQSRSGNLLTDILQGQDTKNLANIAGFFRTPSFTAFDDNGGPDGSANRGMT
jgi:hypothetical protein